MVSLCPQLPWVESQAKFNQFRSSPINLDWFSPPLQLQKVQEALYQATLVSHESAKLTQTSYRLLGAAADADHVASTVRPCAGHVPYAPAPSQYAHFVLLSTGLVSAAVLCTPRTHGPPLSISAFQFVFYFLVLSIAECFEPCKERHEARIDRFRSTGGKTIQSNLLCQYGNI